MLARFRADCEEMLSTLRRCLRHTSLSLRGQLKGGRGGGLTLHAKQLSFEGALQLSRIISPPVVKPYTIHTTVLPSGRLQLLLSLPSNKGEPASPPLPSPSSLVTAVVGETRIVLLAGEAEALQLNLIRVRTPMAPSLPPLSLASASEEGEGSNATRSPLGSPHLPTPPPPMRRVVALYENQRRLTMLRPYSADDLLPLDPARFSDEAMKV